MDFSEGDEEAFLPSGEIQEEYPAEEAVGPLPEEDEDFEMEEEGEEGDEGEQHDPSQYVEGEAWFAEFHGHNNEPVYSVDMHPSNSRIVASGGGDDRAFLWRSDNLEVTSQLAQHGDSVVSVKFSKHVEGRKGEISLLAVAGLDSVIRIYRVNGESGETELIQSLEGPVPDSGMQDQEANEEEEESVGGGGVVWIDWHPKGSMLLAGFEDGTAWMWNALTGECIHVFAGHADSVSCGQFSPDGKFILTGSTDATMILWNPKDGQPSYRYSGESLRSFHQTEITCLAVNSQSSLVMTGGSDGQVKVARCSGGQGSSTLVADLNSENVGGHVDSVEAIGFAPNASMAASASLDGRLIIWDLQPVFTKRLECFHDPSDQVILMKWLPVNEPLVLTGTSAGHLRVWDARTGQVVRRFRGRPFPVLDVSMRIVGGVGRLAVAFDDGIVAVYNQLL